MKAVRARDHFDPFVLFFSDRSEKFPYSVPIFFIFTPGELQVDSEFLSHILMKPLSVWMNHSSYMKAMGIGVIFEPLFIYCSKYSEKFPFWFNFPHFHFWWAPRELRKRSHISMKALSLGVNHSSNESYGQGIISIYFLFVFCPKIPTNFYFSWHGRCVFSWPCLCAAVHVWRVDLLLFANPGPGPQQAD